MTEKTWHTIDCVSGTHNLNLTLCEDGDLVIRTWDGDTIVTEQVLKVGSTYMSAYRKLIYTINEMESE